MKLFASTNEYEYNSGLDFMKRIFTTSLGNQVRINGNLTSNGWYTYNPGAVPVYLKGVNTTGTDNCLQITGVNGTFNITSVYCYTTLYAFFEFVRT